ncbi:MAG: phosphotransferase, partial [Corynebacterium casei]
MNLEQQQVVDIAQDLLSRRFGGQQKLSEVERLSGSGHAIVLRARVSSSPFLQQRTVVLKHNPPTGQAIDDVAFISEVVAYQFTTSLSEDTRPGPVLLAHDIEQRILVLTDLGDSNTLSDTLAQASDDERMQIIRALGTELGQMH